MGQDTSRSTSIHFHIRLQDAWAKRRFTICFRDRESLSKAAAMLLDYLAAAGRHAG